MKQRIVIITEDSTPDKSRKGDAFPAQLIFSGTFREVRIFSEKLDAILPTELLIISSKYGLIDKNFIINSYSNNSHTTKEVHELNEKLSFVKIMSDKVKDSYFIILLLPAHYLRYLTREGWLSEIMDNHKLIIVTGKSLKVNLLNNINAMFLEKKGVARIGLRNQELIINKIKLYKIEQSLLFRQQNPF
jgi:hypothetical protein